MHNWNFRRVFRCFVCLVLVCCFLVNASPIRAEASGIAVSAWLWVNKDIVIAAALAALGLMVGSNPQAFNNVVNQCADYLERTTTYITNGTIAVLGLGTGSQSLSYLQKGLLQTIWEWLFTESIVVQTPVAGTSFSFSTIENNYRYDCASPIAIGYVTYNNKCVILGASPSMHTISVSAYKNGASYTKFNLIYNSELNGCTGSMLQLSVASISGLPYLGVCTGNFNDFYQILLSSYAGFTYEVYDDLVLGQIQSPYLTTGTEEEILQIEICPIYVDWATGEVSQKPPGSDKKVPYWPVTVPSLDEIIHQDQDQAQSGETDLDFDFETSTDPTPDPEPEPEPDPNPNPDPGGSGTGTGTGTGSGSSSWSPPSDMGGFTLDLKQYFPFCIPFDLYAFFTCLNADPVAPVIDWIIPMPGGGSYPFQIDLSVFNPVAQTLRRLQLLLFCVGLAFKTRDLIKG